MRAMSQSLKRTPLYDAHVALGARMVSFGGWEMPVQYSGILDEHKTVREAVGLFDVSHMGEVLFSGARAAEAVQHLVTNSVAKTKTGAAVYTVMCYDDGGIVDDCIVYPQGNHGDEFLIVVNASNIEKDFAWMQERASAICAPQNLSDQFGLIAVQGPRAVEMLSTIGGRSLRDVPSFHQARFAVGGVACVAGHTGYTGEDGFELFVPAAETRKVWDALLEQGKPYGVKPCGLGARDTLRLEARLSLYGNDIDQTTSPLEAGLGWVVKWDEDFVGKPALLAQKEKGVPRKLIGFRVQGRGIARHDYPILDAQGTPVGKVTSGTTSPTLGYAIGMGYVPAALADSPGLQVDCRGKVFPIELVKGPFYKRSK
jgi:aminomethyltransferase